MTDRAITNNVLIVDEAGKPVGVTAGALNTSGGAGGGAATIADGADVAQGTTTDASSASTVVGLLKNLKAALAGLPTGASIGDGRQVVAAAGTAAQFAGQVCKQVTVTGLSTNTALVVVGSSTVVAAAGTRRGLPLAAGDSAVLDLSNMNLLYVDSLVNGEGVSFLWEA